MEYRALEIKVMHATDIKNVNVFTKMDVYVAVFISGDPLSTQRTPTDKDAGTNPSWNSTLKFSIDEAAAQQNRLSLVFVLRSDRVFGDRDIGEVNVPVKELLDSVAGDEKKDNVLSYQIRTSSGRPKGSLSFSYKLGDKFTAPAPANPASMTKKAVDHMPPYAYPAPTLAMTKGSEPVTAYPAPPPPGAGTYPPPAGGYYPPQGGPYPHPPGSYPPQAPVEYAAPPPLGVYPPPPATAYHSHPPAAAYGYPPNAGYPLAPQGYGYPPPPAYGHPAMMQPQQKKKSKLGLGMGLGAGLLGGLLIGDVVSDMSDAVAYDAGYDAGYGGFDDAGDFDF